MVAASYRSIVGIALETTSGNEKAPTGTNFLPVTALTNMAKVNYIPDDAWRGSMVKTYNYIAGVVEGDLSISGPVFADSIGFLFQSLLPDVVATGSTPTTTVFAAYNTSNGQPSTYTLSDYDGVQTLAYPGTKFSELDIKFSADGLLEYSAKATSLLPKASRSVSDGVTTSASTTVTSATAAFTSADVGRLIAGTGITAGATIVSVTNATSVVITPAATATGAGVTLTIGVPNPTASYSALSAFAGWQPTVTIGGSQRTSTNVLLDAEVDFKRAVVAQPGITGSNSPIFVWSGPLEVSGKLTFVYDDTTDYLNLINNTSPSLVLDFNAGSGTTATEVKMQMTNCSYTNAQTDRGGDFVKMAVDFTARANTTDVGATNGYSPAKVTLKNANASGSYK